MVTLCLLYRCASMIRLLCSGAGAGSSLAYASGYGKNRLTEGYRPAADESGGGK
jgi:hypothetical protein